MMKKCELLAPAGNLYKLKIAVKYGADAIYIGGEAFSLRVAADNFTKEEMIEILSKKVIAAQIPSMIITMGEKGAVYADKYGQKGYCPARRVEVKDTTGAGDSFCAGVSIGLTYGKSLKEACEIGAMLAASVIVTSENVCPRFLPRELGLDMDVVD